MGEQTVPSCQPLYRNSFTYHTVSTSPPNWEECFDFLGKHLSSFTSIEVLNNIPRCIFVSARMVLIMRVCLVMQILCLKREKRIKRK